MQTRVAFLEDLLDQFGIVICWMLLTPQFWESSGCQPLTQLCFLSFLIWFGIIMLGFFETAKLLCVIIQVLMHRGLQTLHKYSEREF